MSKNIELLEEKCIFKFDIIFRDVAHFYKIVSYLNNNVGIGVDNWTINGKVFKHLKKGIQIKKTIYIFNDDVDDSIKTFLHLL